MDESIFGTDIKISWEVGPNGDFKLISGISNAEQAVYNRLMTRFDELYLFEYVGYGNRSYEVLGETHKKIAANKLKIYTEQCLKAEPRVEEIYDVNITFDKNIVIIDVSVKLVSETTSSNLVFRLGA